MAASTWSVFASCTVALAKSRAWRGLITAMLSPMAANSLANRVSKPPVASITIWNRQCRLEVERQISSNPFVVVSDMHDFKHQAIQTSTVSFAISIPTNFSTVISLMTPIAQNTGLKAQATVRVIREQSTRRSALGDGLVSPRGLRAVAPKPKVCGFVNNSPAAANRDACRGKRSAFPTAHPFAHKLHRPPFITINPQNLNIQGDFLRGVAVFAEGGVQSWLQHLQQRLLDQPIRGRRDTELALATVRLRDRCPSYRTGPVLPL